MDSLSWDNYFMGIADAVSLKSHCLSHKYGAIAVNSDMQIISTGYNGPPRGYPHCQPDDLYPMAGLEKSELSRRIAGCPRHMLDMKSGEGLEYCPAAHAERNVLINAARYGIAMKGCKLYITSPPPCRECAKEIVNAGITSIVYIMQPDYPEKGITGIDILRKCNIELIGML
ncbi:MAG: dCMP deaminase family protein [Candidatus Omnitrophota bacterium]